MAGCNDNGLIVIVPDIVFHRNYAKFGHINQTSELEYGDIDDLVACIPTFLFYVISILLNSYLLYLNVICVDRRRCKRLPLLIVNFTICNIILVVGFLLYTITIDVVYHVDDIEIIAVHESKNVTGVTFFGVLKVQYTPVPEDLGILIAFQDWGRELLKYQIVNNFGNIQALFIVFIAADRYSSLFAGHNPNHYSAISAAVLISLPFIFSILFFDVRILQLAIAVTTAIDFYLFLLVLTPSLALVLVICAIIRQCQIKAPFRIRNRSLTIALLLIIIIEIFEKCGLAFELLEINFCISFVIGNRDADHSLRAALDSWYELAHGLTLFMPFLSTLLLLLIVRSYREQVADHLQRCWQFVRCGNAENKVDYSAETMRSIIAEQTRARKFRNYASNIEIF